MSLLHSTPRRCCILKWNTSLHTCVGRKGVGVDIVRGVERERRKKRCARRKGWEEVEEEFRFLPISSGNNSRQQ